MVKAAVESEIEDREYRVAHFEDEGREYVPHNAASYYRVHKKLQKEYEKAISELSEGNVMGNERPRDGFERAVDTLQERARVNEAKAARARQYLEENGEDPEEVLLA